MDKPSISMVVARGQRPEVWQGRPAFEGLDHQQREELIDALVFLEAAWLDGAPSELVALVGALIGSERMRHGRRLNQIECSTRGVEHTLDGTRQRAYPSRPWWERKASDKLRHFLRRIHSAPKPGADLRDVEGAWRLANGMSLDLPTASRDSQIRNATDETWALMAASLVSIVSLAPQWQEVGA